jgi:hypothetical protein
MRRTISDSCLYVHAKPLNPECGHSACRVCLEMYSETRYRLVVLGSARVGKTSLIRQYLYKNFSDKYRETVEDLHCSEFHIRGITLTLDILDTSVNYPDMRRLAIRTASAFLLVFAVDDVHSFKQVQCLLIVRGGPGGRWGTGRGDLRVRGPWSPFCNIFQKNETVFHRRRYDFDVFYRGRQNFVHFSSPEAKF